MKKYLKYIIPSIITYIILVIIFYVNNLYPFGIHSIVKVDADYQYIPILYKIFDLLHGHGNLFYSDIGFGNNIFISMVIQGSLFSPVNLLLFFTSRSNIINYYNIIIIVKLCLISLTSYIYINKKFKVDYFYKVVGSVLYTFCGFVVLNFFNMMWLDSVILFPLIIMFLDELFTRDKYIGYIISLSLSLIISYYISYFILVFIVFYSFIYLFLNVKTKEKRKKIIFRLGISTFISLLISSFCIIPNLYQTFISSRFNSSGYYSLFGNVMNKSLYLLFSPLFIILTILYISKYKYNKLSVYRFCLLLFLYVIGIVVEPFNLLMHAGSYWDFPFRYGFITVFILMIGSYKYIEKYGIRGSRKYSIIKSLLFSLVTILLIYYFKNNIEVIINEHIVLNFDNIDIYYKIIIMILLVLILFIISLSFGNKYLNYISLSIASCVSIYIFCSFTMFYENGYFLSINANKYNNEINIKHDGRYKVDYTVYSPDYGFILDVDTLDNWLHVLPNGEVDTYKKIGYETSDTCIRSYGGTIFTDWLFNVKYLISNRNKDDELYELISKNNGKYLYKYKYNQNNGIIFNNIEDIEFLGSFELQNDIYKNMFNRENNIIDIRYYDNDINIKYNIIDKGILYFKTGNYDNISYIKINDSYIYDFDNYIKELGLYDAGTNLDIQIILKDNSEMNYKLGFIRLDDVLGLTSDVKYDNDIYYVNSDSDDNYLFLPINNIKGLNIFLNDKIIDSYKYLDNFVMIKLDKGNNTIKLKYDMPYFKLGIVLSVIGIILLTLYKYIKGNNILFNISYYIFIVLSILMFLYYYFYSMIKYLINN